MFSKKIFQLKNMNLHTKLIISHISVVLIPVIIIGYFLMSKTIDSALTHTDYINQINFNQMKSNIRNQLVSYLDLSNNILFEDDLMEYIQTADTGNEDYYSKYIRYKRIFDRYSLKLPITNSGLIKMSIYTTNSTIISDSGFIITINDETKAQKWYKDTYTARGESIYINPYITDGDPYIKDGTNYISIGKLLNPLSSSKFTNILRFEIPESEIYKLIEKEGGNKKIYILNRNNIIVSSTDRDSVGKNSASIPHIAGITASHKASNNVIKLNNHKNIIFYDEISDKSSINGWKVISVISSEAMLADISSTIKYGVFICFISIIITITLVLFISSTLTKRLEILVNNMSNISQGNFEVFVDYEGADEIAELSRSFKKMVEKINNLINEVYLLDIEKKEAEINALQSQINPHFLFNTMESIRMNLWSKQEYETSEIIQKFSKLLRKSIEWGDDKITLKQELDLVETYLKIQQYRYKDKLEYEINIDKDLYEFTIPKFTLQPIVENAIYHGIEMKRGKGRVSIFSEPSGEGFKIIVQDDGLGMDEEKLASLKEQLSGSACIPGKTRVGVRNVHQRLQLFFGPLYGIYIKSSKDFGTKVEFTLPKEHLKGRYDV